MDPANKAPLLLELRQLTNRRDQYVFWLQTPGARPHWANLAQIENKIRHLDALRRAIKGLILCAY